MPNRHAEIYKEIQQMHDREIVDLIHDTVTRLHALGDRLESYANESTPMKVGFDTGDPDDNPSTEE